MYQLKIILGGSISKLQHSFTTKPKPICGGLSQHKMAATKLQRIEFGWRPVWHQITFLKLKIWPKNVSKATIRLVIDLTGHLPRSKLLNFATTNKNMR